MNALILAGGRRKSTAINEPKVLQSLKGQKVIDYVIRVARDVVCPEDIYVVVGNSRDRIISHLGPDYNYVFQDEQLGTGHAVAQAERALGSYDDNLLILYGDTPLLRERSIQGLINVHSLKKPSLTILTAVIQGSSSFGKVVRDESGTIREIIETEHDAHQELDRIKEINVGAYIGNWKTILSTLKSIEDSSRGGQVLLTDSIASFVREGRGIANYRIYDTSEIVGINEREDLRRAEFIMKKRSFRPMKDEEENVIKFGTGGWRAIIGEGFTFDNVRYLSQSISNKIIREGKKRDGVVIGYDRRFLSEKFARTVAEVIAGNNINVKIFPRSTPTPVVTYATRSSGAHMGVIVTASHNQPKYNGIKIQLEGGYPITDDIAGPMAEEANSLESDQIIKTSYELAGEAGVIEEKDFTNEYIDAVESKINMDAIRNSELKVLLDPMHGVGQVTLETILTEARCQVTAINERRDPLFGGRSPSPDLSSLGFLINHMKEGDYDLGLAMDGDADRIAVVDNEGQYININYILLILYYYLHEIKGEAGPVVRNVATTHLLDRLTDSMGERAIEVPVGFKHISSAMKKHGALLGGESSGGLTVKSHIPGKDGILAASQIVSLLGVTGKSVNQLVDQVLNITGDLYQAEKNIPYRGGMRAKLTDELKNRQVEEISGFSVIKQYNLDGTKYMLGNDNWVLVRFSGTEPVLRIYSEADTKEKAEELIQRIADIFDITEDGP